MPDSGPSVPAPAVALQAAMGGITPHPIVQLGWTIFEPVEQAVEKWVGSTGAGPFFTIPNVPLFDIMHRGKPGTFDHSSTIGQWGDVQLELMLQHCDSPSHIRDLCVDGRPRLTSVSWFAPDLEAEAARLDALGFPEIWRCNLGAPGMAAIWFDTSALLGCYVEVFPDHPAFRAAFAFCKKASEGWSGDRPLRSMDELVTA